MTSAPCEHYTEVVDECPSLVFDRPTFRLHLYEGGSRLELKDLGDRGIIYCTYGAPEIFSHLPTLLFGTCQTPEEVHRYLDDVRAFAGGMLSDYALCRELAERWRDLIRAQGSTATPREEG